MTKKQFQNAYFTFIVNTNNKTNTNFKYKLFLADTDIFLRRLAPQNVLNSLNSPVKQIIANLHPEQQKCSQNEFSNPCFAATSCTRTDSCGSIPAILCVSDYCNMYSYKTNEFFLNAFH